MKEFRDEHLWLQLAALFKECVGPVWRWPLNNIIVFFFWKKLRKSKSKQAKAIWDEFRKIWICVSKGGQVNYLNFRWEEKLECWILSCKGRKELEYKTILTHQWHRDPRASGSYIKCFDFYLKAMHSLPASTSQSCVLRPTL